MLGIVAFGLFVSGVTVWPALPELRWGERFFWGDAEPVAGSLHAFVVEVIGALEVTQKEHPYLMYGYDWLAFAHVCLAILFAGAMRDPVRNIWIVQCGLIMCALVPVLAGICGPLRGMPSYWFFIDAAFAPAAAVPLVIALRDIRAEERLRERLGEESVS